VLSVEVCAYGLGFRIQGLGFRVSGSGFKIAGKVLKGWCRV
jgi:hypothetical protein